MNAASAAITATLPTATAVYTTASWSLFAGQISIEGSNAFLQSISAVSGITGGNQTTLDVGASDSMTVLGSFVPKYPPQVYSELLTKAIVTAVSRTLGASCGSEPVSSLSNWLSKTVAQMYLAYTQNNSTPPQVPPGAAYQTELSSPTFAAKAGESRSKGLNHV